MNDENQMNMDDAFARRTDPPTSHYAAATVNVGPLEQAILSVVGTFGPEGCISEEIEKALPDKRSHSITPRFKKMITKKLIFDTGRTKLASSNKPQRVMALYEFKKD